MIENKFWIVVTWINGIEVPFSSIVKNIAVREIENGTKESDIFYIMEYDKPMMGSFIFVDDKTVEKYDDYEKAVSAKDGKRGFIAHSLLVVYKDTVSKEPKALIRKY